MAARWATLRFRPAVKVQQFRRFPSSSSRANTGDSADFASAAAGVPSLQVTTTSERSGMNGQRTFGLIAAVVVTSALLATSAVAASDALTPEAIHALGARYEAMAQYSAGTPSSLPPQAVRAAGERYEAMADHYFGAGSGGYTPQALRALGERWEAVARYEQQAQLEQARRQSRAFDWADAAIGALAAIGAVALLGLGGVRIRSHGERSASPAAS
jgi:hypothetical protein